MRPMALAPVRDTSGHRPDQLNPRNSLQDLAMRAIARGSPLHDAAVDLVQRFQRERAGELAAIDKQDSTPKLSRAKLAKRRAELVDELAREARRASDGGVFQLFLEG